MPRGDLDVTDSGPIRHFVVCGDNPLAYRLAVELWERYDGHVTAIVPPGQSVWAERIAGIPMIDVVVTDRIDARAFERAHLVEADALALANQDDGGNIDAALVAQEIKPGIRIVLRMFNLSLAESMERMLDNTQVLSSAAIAAPAFVAAALDEGSSAPIKVADRTLVSLRRERADPKDVVLGLAVMGERGTEPETLPPDDGRADLVLAEGKPPARTGPPQDQQPARPADHLRAPAARGARRLPAVVPDRQRRAGLDRAGADHRRHVPGHHRRAVRQRRLDRRHRGEGHPDRADAGQHRADPGADRHPGRLAGPGPAPARVGRPARADQGPRHRGRTGRRRHPGAARALRPGPGHRGHREGSRGARRAGRARAGRTADHR